MILFWILWVIDAIVAAIAIYFFIIGLMDGSVSSKNGMLWAGLLAGLGLLLFATYFLRITYPTICKTFLAVVAVPSFLYGLIIFIAIVTKAKWN